jgi:hypothetical protein
VAENEQQCGIGGLEDDGFHYSIANSGEGAVTSRRIPSRSRLCEGSLRGSIGDDASFQNAFDALRVTTLSFRHPALLLMHLEPCVVAGQTKPWKTQSPAMLLIAPTSWTTHCWSLKCFFPPQRSFSPWKKRNNGKVDPRRL